MPVFVLEQRREVFEPQVLEKLQSLCSSSIHITKDKFEDARLLFQYKTLLLCLPYPAKADYTKVDEVIQRLEQLKNDPPADIRTHTFDGWSVKDEDISAVILFFFDDLFNLGAKVKEYALFVLDVVHNYMKLPYHNINHAISHLQSAYWILLSHFDRFSELENMTLMISCLCHDISHPGYQEEFFKTLASATSWYEPPLLETHHTQSILLLLMKRIDGLFGPLSEEEIDMIASDIKRNVYATYPGHYSHNEENLQRLISVGYDFKDKEFCDAAKSIIMIVCDLSSIWKKWPDNVDITKKLYEEFGEENMMRETLALPRLETLELQGISESQISFINNLALPIFKKAAKLFPCLDNIFDNIEQNIAGWTQIRNSRRGF